MKCPRCQGKGRIAITSTPKVQIEGYPMIVPCPECEGRRETYCCEGSDAVLDALHSFERKEGDA